MGNQSEWGRHKAQGLQPISSTSSSSSSSPPETGATLRAALRILKEHGARESNIVLVTLFATPSAARDILQRFEGVTLLTSEVHGHCPTDFGVRYFGSD